MTLPAEILLNHLPAVYHDSEELRELLSVFEEVLFGIENREIQGLQQKIAAIPLLIDPYATPQEFLPWLGQWLALFDFHHLSEKKQRDLVAEIVPRYAKRGTRDYLIEILAFFIPDDATVDIDESIQGLTVGAARVGENTFLEPERPHAFRVNITSPASSEGAEFAKQERQEWEDIARAAIDLAKPAHTVYELNWEIEESSRH